MTTLSVLWRLRYLLLSLALMAAVTVFASLHHKVAAQQVTIAKQAKTIQNQALGSAAVWDEHTAEKKRVEAAFAIKKEIYSAPQTDDGPVSPVLRRAIDSLPDDTASD